MRLDRVDSTTVANPILWEKGIKVMLGVPLLSGDDVLGVLHVGRLENRPFDDDDVELLQDRRRPRCGRDPDPATRDRTGGDGAARTQSVADDSCRVVRVSASRRVTSPPKNATVGGDWYDLFTLPSGQLWIVVGDVAGHGLQAAVVMGRIRSALRAYTLLDASPEHVLDLVDRKVESLRDRHHGDGRVRRQFDPPYDTMTIAVAGHPPPVIAVPGRPASFAEVERQPTDRNAPHASTAFVDDDHARARRGRRVLHGRPHRAPR